MNPDLRERAKKYIKPTGIKGLYLIERETREDERGFFREIFHLDELKEITGVDFQVLQANHAYSIPGVIRGLHAERWNKLIYPATGTAFCAFVDIREDSETFGKVETFTFSDGSRNALFVPIGLANSVCASGDDAVDYIYLVDSYWDGSDTYAVAWDDPDLNIDWPIKNPIISERDKNNPKLRDLFPEKFK